jgi:uncharacterized radical SAM superfamily Fe-S cluster-containing enzyme
VNVELGIVDPPRLLKETTSRCPVCRKPAPAAVIAAGGKVYLRRTCPGHGEHTALIASDERFYHLSRGRGCGTAACSCEETPHPAAEGNPFEVLSTCIALIEIVRSCNLACPTCFSDSPLAKEVDCIPLDEFRRRVEGVIERKGAIEILQLSGGEPTIHPQFFALLDWAQGHGGIGYVLINTNGVRFGADPAFAAEFDRRYRRGKVQLYLQYDGPQAAGQRELRGADLRASRRRAIEIAGGMQGGGLPVTLAMTVTRENLGHLWETIEFGLGCANVRGVTFQPIFHSGRVPEGGSTGRRREERLNTADIIRGAVEQSAGRLRVEDFTPLPCGDPNCATIGYLLRLSDGIHSASEFIDFRLLGGFLRDRLDYNLADLARCGCDSEPLGELLKQFELDESHTFRLFIKPFMDAWTWDEDRIDRCCTHVIRPDGELDSFCRYYSGFPGTWHGPP